MTRKELLSKRKVRALRYLVDDGEYSVGYASDKLGDLFVAGIVLEADYEPLAKYLDELMDEPVESVIEQTPDIENVPEEEEEHDEEIEYEEPVENKEFTVIFNSNGGSEIPEQIVADGDLVKEPNTPVKDEQIFAGWYKEENLTNQFNFNTDRVTDNITLFAKWD